MSKELNSCSLWPVNNWEDWEEEIKQDPKLASIIQSLVTKQQEHQGYSMLRGCLLYKGSIVLPKNSSKIPLFPCFTFWGASWVS